MNSPTLKIYLHDNSDCFRIELIGRMQAGDVKEVANCWETSRSSVAGHPLVVDLSRLAAVDAAGRQWLGRMQEEGGRFRDGGVLVADLPARLSEECESARMPSREGKANRGLRLRLGGSLRSVFTPSH